MSKPHVPIAPFDILSCFWLEVDHGHKMITGGMCCALNGRKGIYRIVSLRLDNRTGDIYMWVRKELKSKIGKLQRVDAEDMVYLEPPYNVPW